MRDKPKAVLTTNKPYKDEFLAQMNWMEKEKQRNVSKSDISISIQAKSNSLKADAGKCVCFTFRNDVEKKISQSGYLQICIHKNRCFFRDADSNVGYKITHPTGKNSYCKMAHVNEMLEFTGDFDLKYDDFLELYYIERRGN